MCFNPRFSKISGGSSFFDNSNLGALYITLGLGLDCAPVDKIQFRENAGHAFDWGNGYEPNSRIRVFDNDPDAF